MVLAPLVGLVLGDRRARGDACCSRTSCRRCSRQCWSWGCSPLLTRGHAPRRARRHRRRPRLRTPAGGGAGRHAQGRRRARSAWPRSCWCCSSRWSRSPPCCSPVDGAGVRGRSVVVSRLALPLACSRGVPAARARGPGRRRRGLGLACSGPGRAAVRRGPARVVVRAPDEPAPCCWRRPGSRRAGLGWRAVRRLGGITGDVLGACRRGDVHGVAGRARRPDRRLGSPSVSPRARRASRTAAWSR